MQVQVNNTTTKHLTTMSNKQSSVEFFYNEIFTAFSTTYEVYRIVVNDMVTSAEDRIGLTFNNLSSTFSFKGVLSLR